MGTWIYARESAGSPSAHGHESESILQTHPHDHSVQCAVFEVMNTTWATVMLRLFSAGTVADDNDTPAHHEHVIVTIYDSAHPHGDM